MPSLAFLGNINFVEVIVILTIGLLLFGSRLPEVGRSLGRGLLEFKKGLRGLQDQVSDLDREAERRVDEEIARKQRLESQAPPSAAPSPAMPSALANLIPQSDPQSGYPVTPAAAPAEPPPPADESPRP